MKASSHVAGPLAPPLLELTIGQALADAARRWPEREAIVSVHEGIRLSFAELDREVWEIAAGFHALGLRPGDRIGIWSPNNAAWALTQYAAARAGLILISLNPAYRIAELAYSLKKLGVRALVTAERFKTSNYVSVIETLVPGVAVSAPGAIFAPDLPDLRLAIKIAGAPRPGWIEFDMLAGYGSAPARQAIAEMQPAISQSDIANVQFTSGTTGLTKGAALTHRNILNNGYMVGRAVGLEVGERLCLPVPLYHCFGMVMGNLACLTHGATVIYPAEGFDAAATLRAVADERCTHLYGVPTMFIAMLGTETFDAADLGTLRGGIMAGAPCPIEVMRKVITGMHLPEITIAYGMTETSPVSFQTARDDSLEHRIATVGRVQPHLECKIVRADGATAPTGETGELCTRGYSVMRGYWDEPDQTADTVDADGWMHTGDLATIDEHGYCRIVGRAKDMVIRGGENISPREIEEFLLTHPQIEDAAVVGIPDSHYGEELCAWIRVKPGTTFSEADIIEFCRDRIARFKVPKYVWIVDAFPLTVTGKVQKYLIRERMVHELKKGGGRDGDTHAL